MAGISLEAAPFGREEKEEAGPWAQPGPSTDALHAFGHIIPFLGFSFLICRMRGTGFDDAKTHSALRVE